MNDILEELKKLKSAIDTAKEDKARTEGKIESLTTRLNSDFGLNTVEEAEKELTKINTEIIDLKEKIETRFKVIKENYTW